MPWSPSEVGVQPTVSPFRHVERRLYRHPLYSLVYVTLDQDNGGILRDLSERGAAIQAVGPLRMGQLVRMRFDLMAPKQTPARVRMDVVGRVAWASPSGQAGLHFENISAEVRRQVNEWIFGNLIASIAHASPMLEAAVPEDDNLVLSTGARPAIRVRTIKTPAMDSEDGSLLDWLIDRFSASTLARVIDGLVLAASVLLFFVVVLAVAKALPAWPMALGLIVGVGGFFSVLYWYLFRSSTSGTAGRWLTDMALREWQNEHAGRSEEERFR
jgi:PilZ domain